VVQYVVQDVVQYVVQDVVQEHSSLMNIGRYFFCLLLGISTWSTFLWLEITRLLYQLSVHIRMFIDRIETIDVIEKGSNQKTLPMIAFVISRFGE